jgi:uncharacterized membrane protein YraQ (UPF0718 family)
MTHVLRPTRARLGLAAAGLLLVAAVAALAQARLTLPELSSRFQGFVTIFLGIFIEAAPFLLMGSLASGLIEVFVSRETILRLAPRRALPAALVGAGLGFAFPVCECGVVPVTRRLQQKGLPLSTGVAFLLAAPVVNPVVIASTYAAFGAGPILYGRVGFTFAIAAVVGLLFHLARPEDVLLPDGPEGTEHAAPGHDHHDHDHGEGRPPAGFRQRLVQAGATAGDDFLDMARYLVFGSLMAAAMQTVVPQSALLALGRGPVSSVLTLMALAFVLSICSTVDAFVALAFANTFTSGAILSFLVFGPMVDIKSSLMFLGVFRRRAVLYLILLPLMLTMLIAIYINLNTGW